MAEGVLGALARAGGGRMTTIRAVCIALLPAGTLLFTLVACPPPGPPAPVPPDADAAPAPPAVVDADPVPSDASTSCKAACAQLTTLCGPQHADCVVVLQMVNDHSTIRIPCGHALCPSLTCDDIASATTAAAERALGIKCP